MKLRRPIVLLASTVVLVLASGFGVRACIDGATKTEITFHQAWPFCDQDLIGLFRDGWGVTDDSWDAAGTTSNCDTNLPYAKVMNAIAFIGGAPVATGVLHQRGDYYLESRANSTPYHGDVTLRFIEDHGAGVEGTSNSDRTDLDCPIFNYPGTTTPSDDNGFAEMLPERSAVIIHEMWHHWQDSNGYDSSHINGPTGGCTASGAACDFFYPHAPGSALPDGTTSDQLGSLNKTYVVNNVGLYFHSPYQIMVEFETDVSNVGTNFMPYNLRREARSVGNVHITSNFVNAPAFLIGVPAPFPKLYP